MADMYKKRNSDLEEAKKELETWKAKAEKADDAKSRLIMEKLEEDETKEKAKQEMLTWASKQDECRKEFTQSMSAMQDEIQKLDKSKQDLLDKLKRCQAELNKKKAESTKLKQKFKIHAQIPDTDVKFSAQHKEEDNDVSQPIKGVFTISQRSTLILQGGQALITFEEEKVASQILKIAKCSVSCENMSVDVKPRRIPMDPAVKFEVHIDVSRKELKFYNVQPSMPEERMRDRLEMSFSRPSRGGGEVEGVQYDKNTGTGQITFLHPEVAGNLALRGKHNVDLAPPVSVPIGPVYKYDLHKFQTFCGTLKRTILLDEIKDVEDEEDLQDHLEIHFQKPSNCGGEIDSIKYISRGNALQAIFCNDMMERDN
ncbi:N-myc-interactor [Anabas testudineus]|uniref:NID domain-containing protein n=1 Tax=Anabas testudineus TaxID=64144 RepID=A0A3Q1HKQ0_ANATE|nr:N-myc-interactor [Anabas testudineus]XP_026232057.1 N-myc-interactor [Anabas testudineus]